MSTASRDRLGLRSGDSVEVRSREEILATLGGDARLDSLVFMPEMFDYCGQRFRVAAVAHKTCDTLSGTGGRRMDDAVHLEGVRCDGGGHGGCQAACLMFWKEAWLKRVDDPPAQRAAGSDGRCSVEAVDAATRGAEDSESERVYACQITELLQSTTLLPWWDVRQYVGDVRSGNVRLPELLNGLYFRLTTNVMQRFAYGLMLGLYNRVQGWLGNPSYPFVEGRCSGKTPRLERLDLAPGDWVEVKGLEEIEETIDERRRNRGLVFDKEMAPYCGERHRVFQRVSRIIDERTGRMLEFKNDCIMLEGAICRSRYSDRRIACPRAIYSYWREGWLKRVDGPSDASGSSA